MSDPARAAEPILAALRAVAAPGHDIDSTTQSATDTPIAAPGYPATAAILDRVLRGGTLAGHLTPKALGALAAELLESLPATADAASDGAGTPITSPKPTGAPSVD